MEESYISINNDILNYTGISDSMALNGKTFLNVITYENKDQFPYKRYEKVLVSKSIGIIAIQDLDGAWLFFDDAIKPFRFSDVSFIRSEC